MAVAHNYHAWQPALSRLAEWSRNPKVLEEPTEGIPAPTDFSLKRAMELASFLAELDSMAPTCVSTDGEGGVTLEWYWDNFHRSIEIQSDGQIEEFLFKDCRMVLRRNLLNFTSENLALDG